MTEPVDAVAERAKELKEEQAYVREVWGADAKRSINDYITKKVAQNVTSKMVRGWALSELVPDAVKRTYDIGMGVQTFNTPTAAGNVVQVEAPAAVQRAALHDIISIGLPTQLGLVDDDGNTLPGVIALGEYDMLAAQQSVHGDRYVGIGPAINRILAEGDRVADVLPPRATGGYELPPDHELVTVEEGIGAVLLHPEDAPPAPVSDAITPEQAALARHRARMKKAKHKPVPAAPSSILRD